jgi:hypothetical protein
VPEIFFETTEDGVMRMANMTETSHLAETYTVSGPYPNGDWLGPVYIERTRYIYIAR